MYKSTIKTFSEVDSFSAKEQWKDNIKKENRKRNKRVHPWRG